MTLPAMLPLSPPRFFLTTPAPPSPRGPAPLGALRFHASLLLLTVALLLLLMLQENIANCYQNALPMST